MRIGACPHAQAHVVFGFVMGLTNRAERAMAESRHALELDPNLAFAHAMMGLHALHLGRGEETEGHIREALRLSPFDAFAYPWIAIVGFAKNSLGRFEEAIAWLQRGISRNSKFAMAHFHLGSALAHLGRLDEARAAAAAGLALDPTLHSRASEPRSLPTIRTISPGATGSSKGCETRAYLKVDRPD